MLTGRRAGKTETAMGIVLWRLMTTPPDVLRREARYHVACLMGAYYTTSDLGTRARLRPLIFAYQAAAAR